MSKNHHACSQSQQWAQIISELYVVALKSSTNFTLAQHKAELLQEVLFPHTFICRRHFSNEKVGNRKN